MYTCLPVNACKIWLMLSASSPAAGRGTNPELALARDFAGESCLRRVLGEVRRGPASAPRMISCRLGARA